MTAFTYRGIVIDWPTVIMRTLRQNLFSVMSVQKIRCQAWATLHRQFATRNHLRYSEVQDMPALPIFPLAMGTNHRLMGVVAGEQLAQSFWAGTYVYEVKGLDLHATFYTHALFAHTTRALPHLFFDGGSRTQRSGKLFLPDQRLSVVELDKYYKVYVPTAYHTTANSLLTPEVRENLIRLGGQYTIELLDQGLYITRPRLPKATVRQLTFEMETLLLLKQAFEAIAPSDASYTAAAHLRRSDSWSN